MHNLCQELDIEKRRLNKCLALAEKQIAEKHNSKDTYNKNTSNTNNIKNVNVMIKGNSTQFYIKGEDSLYQYVSKNNTATAIQAVNQQYYSRLITSAKKELLLIAKLQNHIDNHSFEKIYKKLGKAKQLVVTPIEMPEDQFIADWLSKKYEGKPFDENGNEYYSDRGERVRSKSEKIIADKLFHENILYRYEYPLYINGWGTIYPDFTILDVPNRRIILYEHFGMMNDCDYANKAVSKINKYAGAGYILGDNLYITMETSEKPFDSRILDGIIKQLKS